MRERATQGFLSSLVHLVDAFSNDVQKLGREAMDLAREVAASSHKTGRIGSAFVGGGATVLIGAILLCLMFVHLLAWLAPNLPMWACYAVIGFPVLGAGIGILAWGRKRQMMTLDPLQEQSAKVVQDVKETGEHVGQQLEAARESLHETVESIRSTLDLREQVDRRPWAMLAGAVSLGYIGGAMLQTHSKPGSTEGGTQDGAGPLERLGRKFAPEIAHLKGLALGTVFGIVRDLTAGSIPKPLEKDVGDMIDGLTVKFGGTPVQGHFRESPNGHRSESMSSSSG